MLETLIHSTYIYICTPCIYTFTIHVFVPTLIRTIFNLVNCRPQASSALFFKYNTQLGPPYHILVDTNFINFSIKNKLDIVQSMMDCLYAKCEYNTCQLR